VAAAAAFSHSTAHHCEPEIFMTPPPPATPKPIDPAIVAAIAAAVAALHSGSRITRIEEQ
jgi:hypothetical protein